MRGQPQESAKVQAQAGQTTDGDMLAVTDKPHVSIQEPAEDDEPDHNGDDDDDDDDDSDDAVFEPFQGCRKTLLKSRECMLEAFQASRRSKVVPVVPAARAHCSISARAGRKSQSPFHLWREMKAKLRAARSQHATELGVLRVLPTRQRGSIRTQFTRSLTGDAWENTAEEPESPQPHKSSEVRGSKPSSPAHGVQVELNSKKRAKLARGMGIHPESIADAVEVFNRLEEVKGEALLSKEDFVAILKRMGDLSKEHLNCMWHAADANNDGEVNWTEFLQWYKYHCWAPELLS